MDPDIFWTKTTDRPKDGCGLPVGLSDGRQETDRPTVFRSVYRVGQLPVRPTDNRSVGRSVGQPTDRATNRPSARPSVGRSVGQLPLQPAERLSVCLSDRQPPNCSMCLKIPHEKTHTTFAPSYPAYSVLTCSMWPQLEHVSTEYAGYYGAKVVSGFCRIFKRFVVFFIV